jgi:sterol-4alpha-carboxylate 3-dehydrogenase (decarboxylating)
MELPKILVTGGSGFLGSEIVKQLVETKQYSVTVMDINPPSMGTETFSSVHYVRANVLKPEELHNVFQEAKPTMVIHTVGIYDVGDARYTSRNEKVVFEVNVEGTRNVVEAAKKCGAKGLVYTSSFTVLVDEIEADFRNADETWPTGRARLAYGKSKVVRISLRGTSFRLSLPVSWVHSLVKGYYTMTPVSHQLHLPLVLFPRF